MIEKIKGLIKQKSSNPNLKAKRDQMIVALVIASVCLVSYGFYLFSTKRHTIKKVVPEELAFDGVFDSHFSENSDEAVLLKQQKEIDALNQRLRDAETKREKDKGNIKPVADENTKRLIQALNEKLNALEEENKKTNEKLQVAMLKTEQASLNIRPPTREEQAAKLRTKAQRAREYYRNAGLETVRFQKTKRHTDVRSPANYVWAGTFVSGIMLTGVMGDAGINGTKNTGTVLIRLDENGTMPNGKRSRLKDCFVLGSSFGDLSGDSVVIHLETLSCARSDLNFELKVYGSVYDQDAMQDVRGTPVLKTKPLLEYSAAAGILAGIGDGLRNLNTAQTINPGAGTITTYGQASTLLQSAGGGAVSNPANKVSDYIMKIADIYHPLVVARAGRRVSVMFIKGFWIDKAHQKFESGKAIDNQAAQNDDSATRTTITSVQPAPDFNTNPVNDVIRQKVQNEIAKQQGVSTQKSEQAFLAEKGLQPLFTEASPGGRQ